MKTLGILELANLHGGLPNHPGSFADIITAPGPGGGPNVVNAGGGDDFARQLSAGHNGKQIIIGSVGLSG